MPRADLPDRKAFEFTRAAALHKNRGGMATRSTSTHPLAHVDEYLSVAQKAGASDVHLGVNAPPIWRLHGTLQPIWPDAPILAAPRTAALADGFLTDLQKSQLADRGDADFAYANKFGRFRTS